MLPSWGIPLLPGVGLEFKKLAAKFNHMNGYISIARDKDSGRVYADATGMPKIAYSPSATDKAHCLEGLIGLAKMCYVTGAEEIYITNNTEPYIRSVREADLLANTNGAQEGGVNNPAFQSWLTQVRATGLPLPGSCFGSAHQMGSCRMGTSERTSVVDPQGQVWGTENLYVADASIFPSASGVNPMVTNMAISDWISRGLAKEMRDVKGVGV